MRVKLHRYSVGYFNGYVKFEFNDKSIKNNFEDFLM